MAFTPKTLANNTGLASVGGSERLRVNTGRGVLSAAEIEALLRPDIPEDAFEEPKTVTPRTFGVLEEDPEREAIEDDAAALAARLTLALRRACEVEGTMRVTAVKPAPLSYLVSQHKGDPVLVLFCDKGGNLVAGLTLDHHLALMIIDYACGGGHHQPASRHARSLSILDKSILEEVLRPLALALDPAYSIASVEPNRSAAHALLPPGKGMLADLSCQIAGIDGKGAFARLRAGRVDEKTSTADPNLKDVMTTLTARIASLTVPVSRLSDLKAGSVLLLGLPIDQPVELLTGGYNGKVVAEGDVGRKGNRIAVRITKRKPTL